MTNNRNDFEEMGKSIVGNIYPYLIQDLKFFYNKNFDNKIIAELGTGPGFILKELDKENFKFIYGIDISLDMLERAQKRNSNSNKINLFNANVEMLPFKTNSIDLIISRGSIFFWKNLDKAFSEIYRVLKPNGFLLIGGGYGISTPDSLIEEIISYYKKKITKNEKPKLDIDMIQTKMNKINQNTKVITKPKHGFWITWEKKL